MSNGTVNYQIPRICTEFLTTVAAHDRSMLRRKKRDSVEAQSYLSVCTINISALRKTHSPLWHGIRTHLWYKHLC